MKNNLVDIKWLNISCWMILFGAINLEPIEAFFHIFFYVYAIDCFFKVETSKYKLEIIVVFSLFVSSNALMHVKTNSFFYHNVGESLTPNRKFETCIENYRVTFKCEKTSEGIIQHNENLNLTLRLLKKPSDTVIYEFSELSRDDYRFTLNPIEVIEFGKYIGDISFSGKWRDLESPYKFDNIALFGRFISIPLTISLIISLINLSRRRTGSSFDKVEYLSKIVFRSLCYWHVLSGVIADTPSSGFALIFYFMLLVDLFRVILERDSVAIFHLLILTLPIIEDNYFSHLESSLLYPSIGNTFSYEDEVFLAHNKKYPHLGILHDKGVNFSDDAHEVVGPNIPISTNEYFEIKSLYVESNADFFVRYDNRLALSNIDKWKQFVLNANSKILNKEGKGKVVSLDELKYFTFDVEKDFKTKIIYNSKGDIKATKRFMIFDDSFDLQVVLVTLPISILAMYISFKSRQRPNKL